MNVVLDPTIDYRALYEEISTEEDTIAYFVALGTHHQPIDKVSKKYLR